jgi:hypothetical protein
VRDRSGDPPPLTWREASAWSWPQNDVDDEEDDVLQRMGSLGLKGVPCPWLPMTAEHWVMRRQRMMLWMIMIVSNDFILKCFML